jgi:UDP-GlcNAc3NAcA epimerase
MAKIITIIGARPQFIKAAPVSAAFGRSALEEVLVHTGQHFDANMSDVFFKELGIPHPRHNLAIHGGSHGDMTGRMLAGLEQVMLGEKPDGVLIFGDTNSTLAGALAAAKLKIPVFHVEAGLRSFNRAMPEEINRVVADHLSHLLFCPNSHSVANLRQEGLVNGVHLVGDVMYDATLQAIEASRAQSFDEEIAALTAEPFVLCTIHRAENTGDPARLQAILDYVASSRDVENVVFPVHPRTRSMFEGGSVTVPLGITMINPLGYLAMQKLLSHAVSVYTDSGGLQKEAYFHRVPCVTLRDETEWVETIDAGWNRLWSVPEYSLPRETIGDYGDGHAAELIVALIEGFLANDGERAHITRV